MWTGNFYHSGVSAWMGHAPFAHWLVASLKPRIIVELGSHYGDSFFAFCGSVKENKTGSKCFAVDSWRGDKHSGFYGRDVFDAVNEINEKYYKDFSTLIKSDFNEAANQFEDGSIDLLHIDGLHTYEAVRQDVETWIPKLSRDGVLLLHDTHEKREDFGVHRLWDELMDVYPNHLDFTHSHGLGVLSRSDAFPLESKVAESWGPNWKIVLESMGHLSRQISEQKAAQMRADDDSREKVQTALSRELESQSLLTGFKTENAELATRSQEAERQLGVVTNDLNRILASRSWLATRPFRYVVRRLRIKLAPRS